jgi:hypothetical protein
MPQVGIEHTIPASKRAKTVHALDYSATVTGEGGNTSTQKSVNFYQIVRTHIPEDNSLLKMFSCSISPHSVFLSAETKINSVIQIHQEFLLRAVFTVSQASGICLLVCT